MENRELKTNVFDAALLRLDDLFNTFDTVCISLSGGKNSTVLLHLAAAVARVNNKKLTVLFIDREAHHPRTIEHIHEMKNLYANVINEFYWIALPLTTVGESAEQKQEWISWEEGVEWWRAPPQEAITHGNLFSFYHTAMAYEAFICGFINWLSDGKPLAFVSGMTTDSLLGHDTLSSLANSHMPHPKTTEQPQYADAIHSFFPLFDWLPQDIWLFNSLSRAIYNPLYDLMYRTGAPLHHMKIHEPFELMVTPDSQTPSFEHPRVNNGNKNLVVSEVKYQKTLNQTWHSYASFLLNTMPRKIAEQYRENIMRYQNWHQAQGYYHTLPDEQQSVLESNGIVSWEKICTMILENDYRCRALTIHPVSHNNAIRKKVRKGRGHSNQCAFL